MRKLIFACAFASLSGCSQPPTSTTAPSATANPARAAADALELTCAAFADATLESLQARFGAANVINAKLPGGEGEEYEGTVLFPNDPTRRLEISWRDAAHHVGVSGAHVSGGEGVLSQWSGPRELTLGESMADVQAANGKAFQVSGFDWDYGGVVTEWNGGAFAPANNCVTQVGFDARAGGNQAEGDANFASDSAAMKSRNPYVSSFGVGFVQQSD